MKMNFTMQGMSNAMVPKNYGYGFFSSRGIQIYAQNFGKPLFEGL